MISKDVKTPNNIDSKTRKAILYFFELISIEKFQDRRMQIGIRNAVSSTNSKLRPSTPKVTFMLKN